MKKMGKKKKKKDLRMAYRARSMTQLEGLGFDGYK